MFKLDGLLGLQDLIANESNEKERDRYLRQVFDLSERMKIVVDDLLSVSWTEGRLELEIAPWSLEDMIHEVISGLENNAIHKDVQIVIEPPISEEFPPELLTDKSLFKGIMHR